MAGAGNPSVSGSFVEIKVAFVLAILLLAVLVQGSPIIENRSRSDNGVATYDNSLGIEASESRKVSSHVGGEFIGPAKHRPKRLSDQRRAELETLMALSKMTGRVVSESRGVKQTNAGKSGRRRRSISMLDNLKNLNFLFQLSGSLSQKGNRAFPVAG